MQQKFKKLHLNIEIDAPENAKNINYYFKDNVIYDKFYLKLKKRILIIINVENNIKGVMVKLDTTKMKKIYTNTRMQLKY